MYLIELDPNNSVVSVNVPTEHVRLSDRHMLVSVLVEPRWQYVPETKSFLPPPRRRWVTKLAFRNRFTQAELVALEIAGLDNPAAAMAQRQQAAGIRVMLANLQAASYIDLDRTDTQAGVRQLEAGGLIATGRADQILLAPVQPAEYHPDA